MSTILPRVLVVEDDPLVLRAVERGLAQVALVVSATSVAEAMLLLGDRGWGLLLLDGELGDGTALDVLAAAPAPRAAVVVMTGSRDPRFHRALRLANVDKVVEKPFEMSALRALVLKLTSEASGA